MSVLNIFCFVSSFYLYIRIISSILLPVRLKIIPSGEVKHKPKHFCAHEYPYCRPTAEVKHNNLNCVKYFSTTHKTEEKYCIHYYFKTFYSSTFVLFWLFQFDFSFSLLSTDTIQWNIQSFFFFFCRKSTRKNVN